MELNRPLAQYATRFHGAVGASHHVASPLGAWLVLALCGAANTAADTDAPKDDLAVALGMAPDQAVRVAAELLGTPHPAVAAAAAIWQRITDTKADFSGLPPAVETGELPDQAHLDAWAREHTFGLIDKFPLQLDPDTLLVLASALATRVSWDEPFELVPAERLGASPWAGRLNEVLDSQRRPDSKHGHDQHIVSTPGAGDVAVHSARAREGLLVTSVIADPGVPAELVIAAAYDIVSTGGAGRRSLFDLPLGEAPLWTIVEEPIETSDASGREEWCTAVLPAWSARSDLDLSAPELGFPAAAHVLARALRLKEFAFVAKQAAVAKYTRVGFEAAAVTAMMMMAGFAPTFHRGVRRTAELRFGHPYAVVATAQQPGSPWHGVPVFSAWIAEPDDA